MGHISKAITPYQAARLGVTHIHQITRCARDYRGSGLYVLEFDNGVKIGISNRLCSRVKNYEFPWSRQIKQEAFYKIQSPFGLELLLKRCFRRHMQPGSTEFIYGVPFERIVRFIERNRLFTEVVE